MIVGQKVSGMYCGELYKGTISAMDRESDGSYTYTVNLDRMLVVHGRHRFQISLNAGFNGEERRGLSFSSIHETA